MNKAREELLKQLSVSARIDRANAHVQSQMEIEHITGLLCKSSKTDIAYHSFLAGYDEACEHACKELLAENQSLQSERMDMAIGQKRIAGLTRLLDEVFLFVADHPDKCECGLCRAIETVND